MLDYVIHGSLSNLSQQSVRDAMTIALYHLKIRNEISLEIFLEKQPTDEIITSNGKKIKTSGTAAFSSHLKYGRIRIYQLESIAEMLKTIFHEMKHIEQMDQGRLEYYNNYCIWEGETVVYPYPSYPFQKERPWEVEAINFENEMYNIVERRMIEKRIEDNVYKFSPMIINTKFNNYRELRIK